MNINQIFELSMMLDHEKFHKVFRQAYSKVVCMENREDEYIDCSLEEKGITVIYRDSQYKKKIRLIVNIGRLLNGRDSSSKRIIRKLNKHIDEYFNFKYKTEDFSLSGMRLVADINVGNHENVQAYLQVFRRIGKVKGFSLATYECLEDVDSFCLEGNSNGVEFMNYDLEGLYRKRLHEDGIGRKQIKKMVKESEGILRVEVRLVKSKIVWTYSDGEDISKQIITLLEKCQDIFFDTFVRVIPFGDFYKKGKAEEIIRSEIKDNRLKRQMIRLVALIPEKKSLYLAHKAMNCRDIDKIMDTFAKINVSPVTISKRQDVRLIRNIYEYLCK